MIYTMTSNNTVYWNKIDKTFFGGENKLAWYEYSVLAGAGGLNGTGDNQGTVTHTSSSSVVGDPLKAFNGTTVNTSDQLFMSANTAIAILKFEFPTPTIVNHYRVWGSPSRTDRNPYDWTVQGSNDDLSWNILHTVDNATSASAPEQPGSFTKPTSTSIELDTDNKRYSFENTIPYIYYKYEVTDWTSRQNCGIAQLAYYNTNIAANREQISSIDMSKTNDVIILGSTLDISSTSTYSRVRIFHLDSSHEWSQNGTDIKGNTDEGFGHRVKVVSTEYKITIAISSGYSNSNNVTNSGSVTVYEYTNILARAGAGGLKGTGNFDGEVHTNVNSSFRFTPFNDTLNANYWGNTDVHTSIEPAWITFEFPIKTIINMYRIWLRNFNDNPPRAPKTWIIQGSNDNSSWITLDTQTNITSWSRSSNTSNIDDAINCNEFTFENYIEYKYYRLYITDQTHANSIYIGEIGYFFVSINSGSDWNMVGSTIISTNNIINGGFGTKSIDFNSTGTRIAIGQPHIIDDTSGQIFIYDFNKSTNVWDSSINPINGGTKEKLGESVVLSDDGNTLLACGSGSYSNKVKLYDISNNSFILSHQFNGLFQCKVGQDNSIAISSDGYTIAIADQIYSNNRGYVEVYNKENSTWKTKGPRLVGDIDRDNKGHHFGKNGLKLSSDGNRLVVSCSNYNRIGKVNVYDFNNRSRKWILVSTIYSTNKEWFPMVSGGGYGKFGYGLCCDASATKIGICGSGINGDISENVISPGIIEFFEQVNTPIDIVPHSINNKMTYPTYSISPDVNYSTKFTVNTSLNEDINEDGGINLNTGAGGDKTTNDTYISFITKKPYTLYNINSGFDISFSNITIDSQIIIASSYSNDPHSYYPGREFFKPQAGLKDKSIFDSFLLLNSVSDFSNNANILTVGGGTLNGSGDDQGTTYYSHTRLNIGNLLSGNFNSEGDGSWYGNLSSGTATFKYTFPSDTSVAIGAYRLWATAFTIRDSNSSFPKAWTFEGSNDDSSWNILDTQSNITSWTRPDPSTTTTDELSKGLYFTFANYNSYKHYRFFITEIVNSSYARIQLGQVALYRYTQCLKIDETHSSTSTDSSELISISKSIQLNKSVTDNVIKINYFNNFNEKKLYSYTYNNINDSQLNTITSGSVRYIKLLMTGGEGINIDRGYMQQSQTGQNSHNNTGTETNDSNQYIITRFILHVNNTEFSLPTTISYNTTNMTPSDISTLENNATGSNSSNSSWANVLSHGENKYIGGGVGNQLEQWTLIDLGTNVSLETINAIFIEPGNGKGHSTMVSGAPISEYGGHDPSMNFIRGLKVLLLNASEEILNSVTIPTSYRLDAYSSVDQRSIVIEYTQGYSSITMGDLDPTVKSDPLIINPFHVIRRNWDDPKYFLFSSTGPIGSIPPTIHLKANEGANTPVITQLVNSFNPNITDRYASMYLQTTTNTHYYIINDISCIEILDRNIVNNISPTLFNSTNGVYTVLEPNIMTQASPLNLFPGSYTIFFNDNAYSSSSNTHSLDISFAININFIEPDISGELTTISAVTPFNIIDISSITNFEPFDINDTNITIENNSLASNPTGSHYYLFAYAEAGVGALNGTGSSQGTATSSSIKNTNYQPYEAFNGTTNPVAGHDDWRAISTDSFPQWLQFKFPQPKRITMYRIWPGTGFNINNALGCPSEWTLEGSDDELSWTILDTRTGYNLESWGRVFSIATDIENNKNMKEFTFTNNIEYIYYRINITNTTSVEEGEEQGRALAHEARIGQLGLYSTKFLMDINYIHNGRFNLDLRTLKLETGAESASDFTISASSVHDSDNSPDNILSGLLTNDWRSSDTSTLDSEWVKIEFTNPKKIIHYKIWPPVNISSTPKSWTFEASHDDISWITLDEQSNITDWSSPHSLSFIHFSALKEYSIVNNNSYTYYRINITDNTNNIDNSTYIGKLALYTRTDDTLLTPVSVTSTPSIVTPLTFNLSYNMFNTTIIKNLTITNPLEDIEITPPTSTTINKPFNDPLIYTIQHNNRSFVDLSSNVTKPSTFKGELSHTLLPNPDPNPHAGGGGVGTGTISDGHGIITSSGVFTKDVTNPTDDNFTPIHAVNGTLADSSDCWISDLSGIYTTQAGPPDGLDGTGGDQGVLTYSNINNDPFILFNTDYSYTTMVGTPSTNPSGGWVKFEFPDPQVIVMYRLWREHNGHRIRRWILEASNDDISWNILHSMGMNSSYDELFNSGNYNPTSTSKSIPNRFREFAVLNVTPYKYYKLTILNWRGSGRLHGISFSSFTPPQNPKWLKYEFINNKAINKYRIWPRIHSTLSCEPKSWTLEASNDDLSWNILDTQSNITNWEQPNSNSITTLTEMKEFSLVNYTLYKYYRLLITESNGSNNYVSIGELALYQNYLYTSSVTLDLSLNTTDRNYNKFIITVDDLVNVNSTSLTSSILFDAPYSNIDSEYTSTKITYELDLHSMATKP